MRKADEEKLKTLGSTVSNVFSSLFTENSEICAS